ncbi:hypothetical protein [Pseudomonas sp. 008]|uniref:hypothetical protein n=1 Tax=Pseudomonas sp. 008 TaxID=2803906 RepID=UPI0019522AEC|nr:hypothetical protein [Pseudomonas sp. 008]
MFTFLTPPRLRHIDDAFGKFKLFKIHHYFINHEKQNHPTKQLQPILFKLNSSQFSITEWSSCHDLAVLAHKGLSRMKYLANLLAAHNPNFPSRLTRYVPQGL